MTAAIAEQQRYSGDMLADLRLVKGELTSTFAGLPKREQMPIRHSLSGEGKMLRPVVVLAASRYADVPAPERIGLAAAVEMLHLASLIHDDIIDCAELRRGRPSLNASWGEGVAILTGDVYFSSALRRLAQLGGGRFTGIFLDCVADMCQSELRQTLARFDRQQTEETYLAAIAGKTASLFAACGRVGGLLAGLRTGEQDSLAKYGWSTGMAFQLADDIADLALGRAAEPAGQDIGAGIWTLPIIHGLQSHAGAELYRLIASDRATEHLPAIRAALHESGSLDYAIVRARDYCREARAALDSLPGAAAGATLRRVVESIETTLEQSEAKAGN